MSAATNGGAMATTTSGRNGLRLTVPAAIHHADISTAEQGLPLQNLPKMEGAPLLGAAVETVSESEDTRSSAEDTRGTLTPSSSQDSPTTEDPPTKTIWCRLFDTLVDLGIVPDPEEEIKRNKSCGYDQFKEEKPEGFPKGFPRLAAFTGSDEDWGMCRRFKYLHWRNIKQLEVEITKIQEELQELDEEDAKKEAEAKRAMKPSGPEYRLRYTRHEKGWDSRQRNLLRKSRFLLKEYRELVFGQAQFEDMNPASKRAHRSYFNYVRRSGPKVLAKGYDNFVLYADDMVTTMSTRPSRLRSSIQDLNAYWRRYSLLRWLLRPRVEAPKDGSPEVTYFSETAMTGLVTISLSTLCALMILVPSSVLFLVPMSRSAMTVVASIVIVVFSAIATKVTEEDTYKVLVSTTTFGAFVVIFLGNLGQSNPVCAVS